MSTIFNNVLADIKRRRERALTGKYNCVPLPFPRFRRIFPGIEKGRYLLITANQKVGKSKFCDYFFIYEPLFFAIEHPELKLKVVYFTLEVTAKEKYNEFLCHLLYRLDNIVIDTKTLMSTDQDTPVPEHVLELIESDRYKVYRDAYEEMVTYIDDIKNPTGITKFCENYAEERGHWTYKKGKKQNEFGQWVDGEVKDKFIWNDEETYYVIILDNAANISTERGLDKRESIDKLSKNYIHLRNNYQYITVLIQHQAQSQESNENIKLNRTYPTSDGLADCKTTSRDYNIGLGLYNPRKHGIPKWEGYDITKFGDHIRFLSVMDDRDYGAGGKVCPLFFNGASSVFTELPAPDNLLELERVYTYIREIDNPNKSFLMMHVNKLTKKFVQKNFKKYFCGLFHFKK